MENQTKKDLTVNRSEAYHVFQALECFEAELEQLMYTHDWFVSDSVDRLASAKEIMMDWLGIKQYEYDEEEVPKQSDIGLCFDD